MKKIAKLYKWEFYNELYASIYFVAMLTFYSIFVLIQGERSVDIFIMLEMSIASYIISVFQRKVMSDDSSYSGNSLRNRKIIWYAISIAVIVISSVVFNWFEDLQPWAMGAFIANMLIFMIFVRISIHIVNKMDTKKLNNQLSHFQENIKINEESE